VSTINLSLVSHTNAGKTTLARSLLGRDVGEIRDEAHVTALAECHRMIETADGQVLNLWDTPGFGDSTRLVKRLRLQGNPLGWLLSEVWDRWRDRPFWSSQQAIRNVRDEADVVLYLVNASETPRDAGYVEPEMEILAWIGKPVLVLLNQIGEPRPGALDKAEEDGWRKHLAHHPFVRDVLTLDAFARCWVQEFALLKAIGAILPADKHASFEALQTEWRKRRTESFETSMGILASFLARSALDEEIIEEKGFMSSLRGIGKAVGIGKDDGSSPREQAMTRLAGRLDLETRRSTDQLIEAHGLGGRAAEEVMARLAADFTAQQRIPEGKAAMLGGVVSGALSGLAADLATGGLTLGAGLVGGAVLGALGSAGLAHGVNLVRGKDNSLLRWSDDSLGRLFAGAVLRYLAVAHYGRGRGEWQQGEYPAHWKTLIDDALASGQAGLGRLLADRDTSTQADTFEPALRTALTSTTLAVLARLYPGTLGQ
jgi:hypothetical protein